jgi:glycerol-3-phosphate acyltransferase PlsX
MRSRTVRVALDAMGGDHGVSAAMGGAARLSLEGGDVEVLAVGDVPAMTAALGRVPHDPRRLLFHHAGEVIGMAAPAVDALRSMPDASIRVAARLVAAGEADALVSAGNTGATVLTAREQFGLIPGVRRAALASVYPTALRHGPHADPFALMLDVGATLQADADALVGFAKMGAAYSSIISEIVSPRVALLSNGSEPGKGTAAIVDAHARLAASSLNFLGNIEGIEIPKGTADVVVCDGFLGNVVLKLLEGMGEVLQGLAQEAAQRSLQWRLGLSLLDSGIAEMQRLTDWKAYGGAPLLGFDHVAIKAHGRSEAPAIRNALKVAAKAVRGDLQGRIANALAESGR